MGLAASQCRLLSMTSRMSDLELRAQLLSNQKVALAKASSQASNDYIKALNGEHLGMYSPSGEYTDATAELLTNRDAFTGSDQLFLEDESGQLLCSEDVMRAYEGCGGNLENFLNRFGCTSEVNASKTINNISNLLSTGLANIGNSTEDIRVANLLTDDTSGVSLDYLTDRFTLAQMSLDNMYREVYTTDADGNKVLESIKALPLTDGAPTAFTGAVLDITNSLLAASCELEMSEDGVTPAVDEYGIYKVAPKRDESGQIIYNFRSLEGAYQKEDGSWAYSYADADAKVFEGMTDEEKEEYLYTPVPNVINQSLYNYATNAAHIIKDTSLNSNRYYYSNEGITSSVMQALNIYKKPELDETGAVVYNDDGSIKYAAEEYRINSTGQEELVTFNATGADLLSKLEASDVYTFTSTMSSVLYEYYQEKGLSEQELMEVINATDVASVACISDILNSSNDYVVPSWFWGEYDNTTGQRLLSDLTIDSNSVGSISVSDFKLNVQYQKDGAGNLILDAYGDPVPVGGSTTSSTAYKRDADGNLILDNAGNPQPVSKYDDVDVIRYRKNSDGSLILDSNGNPVPVRTEYKRDASGNLVLDSNKNPIATTGKAVYNISRGNHTTSYSSMINQFMAYFDAVISDQVNVKSSYVNGSPNTDLLVNGSAVSGQGDFDFNEYLYISAFDDTKESKAYRSYQVVNNGVNLYYGGGQGVRAAYTRNGTVSLKPYESVTSSSQSYETRYNESSHIAYYDRHGDYHYWGWGYGYTTYYYSPVYQADPTQYKVTTNYISSNNASATIGKSGSIPTLSEEIMKKLNAYIETETVSSSQDIVSELQQQQQSYERHYTNVTQPTTQKRSLGEKWYNPETMPALFKKHRLDENGEPTYDPLRTEEGELLYQQLAAISGSGLSWTHYDNEDDVDRWHETVDDEGNPAYTKSTDGTGEILKRQMTNEDGSLKFDVNEEEYQAAKDAAKAASDEAAAAALVAKQNSEAAAAAAELSNNNYTSKTAARQTAESNLAAAQAEQAEATIESQNAATEKEAAQIDLSGKEGAKTAASQALSAAQAVKSAAEDNLSAKKDKLNTARDSYAAAKSARLAADSDLAAAEAVLAATDPDDTEAYEQAQAAVEAAQQRQQQAVEQEELEEQRVHDAEAEVTDAETQLSDAEADVNAKQITFDSASAAVDAAAARLATADTWVANATTRLNNANAGVSSCEGALSTAQSEEEAARIDYETKQGIANTLAGEYATAQGNADDLFAAYEGVNRESFRNVPVWEYADMDLVMRPNMDDYMQYTYTDADGVEHTEDLLVLTSDSGYQTIQDFPEFYQTAQFVTEGYDPQEYELNDETAEYLKEQLKSYDVPEEQFYHENEDGSITPKSCYELMQMYAGVLNAQEDAMYASVEAQNARIQQVITELSTVSTTSESVRGYEDYSKHFAKIYQAELQEALDAIDPNKLTKYMEDLVAKEKESIKDLRTNLSNIEDIVKTFLRDVGDFFDTKFKYTDEIDQEVRTLRNYASQKDFTNEDLMDIKEHINKISSLAQIPEAVEIRYTDESTISYYTNLFNSLNNSSKNGKTPVAIDHDTWNDPDWLKNQLKIGNIHVSAMENGELKQKQYNTSFTYLSTDTLTDAELTKAQAEYEKKVAQISKKEKKIDNELKMIDTEHRALEQQVNSINTNKEDNINRNFNLFS